MVATARELYAKANGGNAGEARVTEYIERWIAAFRLWQPNELSLSYIQDSLSAVGIFISPGVSSQKHMPLEEELY